MLCVIKLITILLIPPVPVHPVNVTVQKIDNKKLEMVI